MRNPWRWLSALFTPAERDPADDPDQEPDAAEIARAARDPLRFRDRESWLRFRRRHGFSNRGIR